MGWTELKRQNGVITNQTYRLIRIYPDESGFDDGEFILQVQRNDRVWDDLCQDDDSQYVWKGIDRREDAIELGGPCAVMI